MADLWIVSLMGAVMILVIIGIRALLQNRLHRTVFLLLWLLVAVRLAVPVMTSSTASIYNFLPEKESVSAFASRESVPTPVVIVEEPAVRDPVAGESVVQGSISAEISVMEPVEIGESRKPMSLTMGQLLTLFWALGCGACVLYFMVVHIRARLRYRFAIPEKGPDYLGKVALKRSDEVSSPLVYGFFRPVILLPYDFPKKDSKEYEQVLHHELTHVRSGDLWYKLAMLVVTCIHWFNPLVWLMLSLSTQDLEIRCDARVIRELGEKKIYAMTLVQAEVRGNHHFAEAAFAFSLTELRLKSIVKSKVYLPRSILLFVMVAVVLVCCFSTGPQACEAADPAEVLPTTQVDVPASENMESSVLQQEEATQSTEEIPPCLSTEKTVEVTAPYSEAENKTELPEEVTEQESSAQTVDRETVSLSHEREEYGAEIRVELSKDGYDTVRLALPESTKYVEGSASDGALIPFYVADSWFSEEEGYLYLTLCGSEYGLGEISFYVDGRYWCKLRVNVGYRNAYPGDEHNAELTFDYESLETMEIHTTFSQDTLTLFSSDLGG